MAAVEDEVTGRKVKEHEDKDVEESSYPNPNNCNFLMIYSYLISSEVSSLETKSSSTHTHALTIGLFH